MPQKYELKVNDMTTHVEVDGPNNGILNVTIGKTTFPVKVSDSDRNSGTYKITVGDSKHTIQVTPRPETSEFTLQIKKQTYAAQLKPITPKPSLDYRTVSRQPAPSGPITRAPKPTVVVPEAAEPGAVTAPLPGRVLEVHVKTGEKVNVGDVLLVLEAMKMANEIRAPQEGKVGIVHVQAGDTVEKGQPMITIS